MTMLDRRRLSHLTCVSLALGQLLANVWPASAQVGVDEPIGPFVVDVRGSITPFGHDVELAAPRGFDSNATPGLGLGVEAGAHVYLYRWRVITFGLGWSMHASAGGRALDVDSGSSTLHKRFIAVSPQLSFNFGNRNGWSYLSGGFGTSRLSLLSSGEDSPSQRGTRTLNYGGGARWFTTDHLALSLDLRFYAINQLKQTDTEPGSPRMTLMVLNIGASFR